MNKYRKLIFFWKKFNLINIFGEKREASFDTYQEAEDQLKKFKDSRVKEVKYYSKGL